MIDKITLLRGALLMGIGALPAQGAAAQSDVVTTVPVPERGIFFVRYGEPGAVEIRRSHPAPPESTSVALAESDSGSISAERIARLVAEELAAIAAKRGQTPPPPRPTPPLEGRQPAARGDAAGLIVLPPTSSAAPERTALPPPEAPFIGPGAAITTPDLRWVVRQDLLIDGLLRSNLVIFETNGARLMGYSASTLDAVVAVMKEFPVMRIRVEGHADYRGSDAYNLDLSERRAAAVKRYLSDNGGIAVTRIESVGFGESQPLVPGQTETARTLNRRVEFRVLNLEDVIIPDNR